MAWNISFISEEDFTKHVSATIEKYCEKLESFDIEKINMNFIDSSRMIFDDNGIDYFHHKIFQYFKNCRIPGNGKDIDWDVTFYRQSGITLPEGDMVHKIYVEMKNKHNTMNSASGRNTLIKMQNQLLSDDDCACFLVETKAKKSQNIKWTTTVDGKNVFHKKIRRVSIDQFYSIVTGQEDAFFQICTVLPKIITKVVTETKKGVIVS